MKFELFNKETNKIWNKASGSVSARQVQFELDLYRTLLNFFQVGAYYYIIFNISNREFEFVSPQVDALLGYSPAELTLTHFMEILHPGDRSWFFTFEATAAKFLEALPPDKLIKYKVRYDYRVKTKGGEYVRVLHQSAVIEHDNAGGIIRTLSVETDITHLKKHDEPVLSFIGMDGEPSYINIDTQNTYLVSNEILTAREKQILLLLIEGKLSKEIAGILNISKQTVDNHRKNMLSKNGFNTTAELVAKAIRNGWI